MKKGMLYIEIFLAVTFMFFVIPPVQATDFTGNSSGIFSDPIPETYPLMQGVGTDKFYWGIIPTDPIYAGKSENWVNFSGGSGFSGKINGPEFLLGQLIYHNGTITQDTGATGITLSSAINFTTGLLSGISKTLIFDLSINNTPNLDTNSDDVNADYLTFLNTSIPSYTFDAGGIEYTLQFTQLKIEDGNIANGYVKNASSLQFHVYEDHTAYADLFAKITTNSVPEPSTLLLLGLSLVGAVMLSRRYKVRLIK